MSVFSEMKARLYPEDFDVWSYEKAPSQTRVDYLSLQQLLEIYSEPKKLSELVSQEDCDKQLLQGSKRRQKLKLHRELLSVSRGLMYTALYVSLISPFFNFRSGVSETAIVATFGLSLSTAFFSNRASKLAKQKIEKEVVSFIPSSDKTKITAIFNTLRENDVAIFACEADGRFKRIKNNFWAVDNCRLAFFTDSDGRKALALNDIPPSGELLFLRSEIAKLFPEKRTQTENQNQNWVMEQLESAEPESFSDEFIKAVIWGESEKFDLQRNLLRSQKRIYDFLLFISNDYDTKSVPSHRKLSPSESATVRALIHILKNFSIWTEILEKRATTIQTKNFKQQLVSIFSSSATGPRSTLKSKMEPGEEAANRLIRGNYAGLKRWLERTKY